MKKVDKSSSAGTTAEQSTEADVSSVSQPIAKPNVVGSLFKSREIKFKVFFYDGLDFSTGEMLSFNEAMAENYIEWDESTLKATDECSILLQYTGLKDKNGKEIYEGDILKSWYSRDTSKTDIVETIEAVEYEANQYTGEAGYELLFLERAVVIGNIFENPELLQTLG